MEMNWIVYRHDLIKQGSLQLKGKSMDQTTGKLELYPIHSCGQEPRVRKCDFERDLNNNSAATEKNTSYL